MLGKHHFISYSTADAQAFAYRLHDALEAGPIPAWLDKRDLHAGQPWDTQIRDAIGDCETLLFVMTTDSVNDTSGCREEIDTALSYKKPIIPLLVKPGVEIPFRLRARQHIDFSDDFDAGMARLRRHLDWMRSPEGGLQQLKDWLADTRRYLHRVPDDQLALRARFEAEIAQLEADIARQQRLIDHPDAEREATRQSIATRFELERQPADRPRVVTKFINPPPAPVPDYFQDRHIETRQIAEFLKGNQRVLTIVGRAGNGKTALSCRLLKALEAGRLPDDLHRDPAVGVIPVDGIVYLSAVGVRTLKLPHLYADLCKLLPDADAQALDALYRNPQVSVEAKMHTLLAKFPPVQRVVVLLDNFEGVIDHERQTITDSELDEGLTALLTAPPHAVKVILTTRVLPPTFCLTEPQRQSLITLNEGLSPADAASVLIAFDSDGRLGLKNRTLDDPLLLDAHAHTRGYPRALEAIVAILNSDSTMTLPDVLAMLARWEQQDTVSYADDEALDYIVRRMVGETYKRLDAAAQQVLGALAIYGRPVPALAVDYLLEPYRPNVDSAPVLRRLVNMHFVRTEGGEFYLHPIDRAYALDQIPHGERSDRFEAGARSFTQIALADRGADYFRSTRKPRDEWRVLADLKSVLAEIDLRYVAEDFDVAAQILLEIDHEYLTLWGYYNLTIGQYDKLIDKNLSKQNKIDIMSNLARIYDIVGQISASIRCYESALEIAHEVNSQAAEAAILSGLGTVYSHLGQYRLAIDYHEQAIELTHDIGDYRSEGNYLNNLGVVYFRLGEYDKASKIHEQTLGIARTMGDLQGETTTLGNLGNIAAKLGRYHRAIQYHEQALSLSRQINDSLSESISLGNIGSIYSNLGQTERAVEFYEQALTISRELGNRWSEGVNLANIGLVYSNLGQYTVAQKLYEQSLGISCLIGDKQGESNCLNSLGTIYSHLGEYTEAVSYFEQALTISRELGDRSGEASRLRNLGDVYSNSGQYDEALRSYDFSLGITQEIGDRYGVGQSLEKLGDVYVNLGQHQTALGYYQKAKEVFIEAGLNNLATQMQQRLFDLMNADSHPQVVYSSSDTTSEGFNVQSLIVNAIEIYEKNKQERITSDRKAISLHPVFGEPIVHDRFKCNVFMIMPFARKFAPIYQDHIVPVVKALSLSIKRGDDFFSNHSIMTDIWLGIIASQLVIAECTGRNPNVFYELGIAHTVGKPVIMITQNLEDIPFDLRHLRVIEYEYTPPGMKRFEVQLENAIRQLLDLNWN